MALLSHEGTGHLCAVDLWDSIDMPRDFPHGITVFKDFGVIFSYEYVCVGA